MSSRKTLVTLAAAAVVALMLAGCGTVASGSPAAGASQAGGSGSQPQASADTVLCQNASAAGSARITHIGGIRAYSEYTSGRGVAIKGLIPGYPAMPGVSTSRRPSPAVPMPAVTRTATPRVLPGGLLPGATSTPTPTPTSTPRVMPGGLLPAVTEGPAMARWLARAVCRLPLVPQGVRNCPMAILNKYLLVFTVRGRQLPTVTVQSTGCRQVTGLGRARSAEQGDALLRKLALLTAGIDGGPPHALSPAASH